MKEEFTVHGTLSIGNAGGYEIEMSKDNETARIRINSGEKLSKPSRPLKVRISRRGNGYRGTYVRFKGVRLDLREFAIV